MTNAFCDDSQPANVDYSIHFNDMKHEASGVPLSLLKNS